MIVDPGSDVMPTGSADSDHWMAMFHIKRLMCLAPSSIARENATQCQWRHAADRQSLYRDGLQNGATAPTGVFESLCFCFQHDRDGNRSR